MSYVSLNERPYTCCRCLGEILVGLEFGFDYGYVS